LIAFGAAATRRQGAKYGLSLHRGRLYTWDDVKYGIHTMSAQSSFVFTADAERSGDTPMEIGPWGFAAEPMLPARHVVWATLALILVSLGVLIFA
jgi:hypothetical protein